MSNPRIVLALSFAALAQGCATSPDSGVEWPKVETAMRSDFRRESLSVVRKEACDGNGFAAWELDERWRAGQVPDASATEIIDEALDHRHGGGPGKNIAWGSILDRALASGILDQDRIDRCYGEAVDVDWWVITELVGHSCDQNEALFTFRPAVGPHSLITYEASIESATLDGLPLVVNRTQEHVRIAHAVNPAPGIAYASIFLPPKTAGKSLAVRWRVRTFGPRTGVAPMGEWVQSEVISLPATGNGHVFGRRAPAGVAARGRASTNHPGGTGDPPGL